MARKGDATYESLKAQAERDWARNTAEWQEGIKALHAAIAKMPDVVHAPTEADVFSHPDIACPCGSRDFKCARWVTVNGVRHRAELHCRGCGAERTWDWGQRRWLGA
jgi:hypothetical protein